MKELFLVCGLPGSGKSTYGRYLVDHAHSNQVSCVQVEADQFMTNLKGEYEFKSSKLEYTHQMCKLAAEKAMIDNTEFVIVSNTFTTPKERKPYLDLADQYGYTVFITNLFDAGLSDEALSKRNLHSVPVATITRMRERWVHPTEDEGFVTDIYWN